MIRQITMISTNVHLNPLRFTPILLRRTKYFKSIYMELILKEQQHQEEPSTTDSPCCILYVRKEGRKHL